MRRDGWEVEVDVEVERVDLIGGFRLPIHDERNDIYNISATNKYLID